MNKILIRYGEIYLKGHNRGLFEKQLKRNIREALSGFTFTLSEISGRYLLQNYNDAQEGRIVERLKQVMGIYSLSIAHATECTLSDIETAAEGICRASGRFKVETKRADKKFPMQSLEVSREVGGYLLERFPNLKVDLFNPDFTVNIEIREGVAYVFSDIIRGCGGLPVGCSGKGLLLLSGGIDSPVAGYMMAKRGMRITGLHFHSYPYTSEQAREKVVDLSGVLKRYTLHFHLVVIPFTEIQNAIHEKCPEEFMVILMRRFMMRIANRVSRDRGMDAIITGENLAQVASQTIQSITVTNSLAEFPVLRPVIGFDKMDIVDIARAIDTYDISIRPYEDCCTVFLPKRPVIKPRPDRILEAEKALDVEKLVENAVQNAEIVEI